ncbi:CoA activase [Anaerococcus sp. AGMB00486]|uniref:CoA activase n=2 Tax=Anaerococcus TaxID=165779 RepID=A0ABX2NAC1_9FIRM|nr:MULTISPECIES: acyl-CoA dehydratase activase [Anaerococcus]MSS77758.1 CoA activase [Anaerococcus porci]NVF11613.1 CoA activase [Anaerococcus faecalis]
MYYVGIDIGSTAAKVCVKGDENFIFSLPTGWSSKETSELIYKNLLKKNIDLKSKDTRVLATGYGRVAVDYADFTVTEISCHARGGKFLSKQDDIGLIDVGGQDTKIIIIEKGMVKDFLMNDKCSAGTGKFIEIMANRLGLSIDELFNLSKNGKILPISSLCTVFAESEIINYIGEGRKKEDIAAGVVDSVADKVSKMCLKMELPKDIILTGGLSKIDYFIEILSKKTEKNVYGHEDGIYAGAIGASLLAKEKKKR